ncbi:MAG: adenosylhomocysteinase [Candidatus Methanoliparum thermophilum]|uniref:Adenosylhomocysteinase n=1 Tax=Methanoliparum thermophilum TaxID=2491083 RepID=A0A520KSI1_METT2|nr:adenosylhomocysteinase [Candidatus Methanoliparum sp. LAM-1]RZN64563.1 MAG: adenosylhomocysteinase [Candidatus Methanoliparum thermophilum]BDC35838.1 adenosylhomocysteinase [Candidatus Methanoliparum sp. LAM-1]
MDYIIKDINLAEEGKRRIEWAKKNMPVLSLIQDEFKRERPLEGIKIAACLHVTVETANLILTLKSGGAMIRLAGSNPLSTQNDVAAAMVDDGIEVFAIRGEDQDTYYRCISSILDIKPNIVLDDGADTIATIHSKRKELIPEIYGGCEETTTGVIRLKSLEKEGALKFPIIAVNDAKTKNMFDNRYGTGQSSLHGIMNATNLLFAGKNVVVVGYGWCGKGVASRARGLGSNVIVVEMDPIKSLEAVMDGFRVMPMIEAAKIGDLFITATGNISVIRGEHFEVMKDGAILSNTGHFNVEINIKDLEKMANKVKDVKESVKEYTMNDGRRIYLLAEGRLINLSSAYGHPPEVMDMSFADQALSVRYIVENREKLDNKVYSTPGEIDERVARLKLDAMNIKIERLTEEQKNYLRSWRAGT